MWLTLPAPAADNVGRIRREETPFCAEMYDFQLVKDVNIALDALGSGLPARERPWMA
jgi:hypothetical protein